MRVTLFAAALAASALAQNCAVSDSAKSDCGYLGINQQQCQAKGCCWNPSSTNGVPWCFYPAPGSCFRIQPAMSTPFSPSELGAMFYYFSGNLNIGGKGGIAAAPQNSTPPVPGGYYFNWARDAALTMISLQETGVVTGANWTFVEPIAKAYTGFVLGVQGEADPNSIDVRVEPKFDLPDGEPYTGGWCRPQNDGPGLRALSLVMVANSLIANGETDFVKQYLWTGNQADYNGGAIKYDLDWVVTGYATPTCDLWEEVTSTDYLWNRITAKRALLAGTAFAAAMGDSASAASYASAAAAINSTLYSSHWTGTFLQEADIRPQDGAVMVALNTGYDPADGLFSPSGFEVASTVATYAATFCGQYPINAADTAAGVPGVLIGRYPGDVYVGGNPWVLTTAALANVLYRAATEILSAGVPPEDTMAQWAAAFNTTVAAMPSMPGPLAQFFAAQGDGVLLRIRQHVAGAGFHLPEQLDKNTGEEASATDLTWSYAEVFNAMTSRAAFVEAAGLSKPARTVMRGKGGKSAGPQ